MRPSRKLAFSIVVAVTVFSSVFGIAATLSVGSPDLGAGAASVASCDTDGVTTTYSLAYETAVAGYKVSTVTVSGIASPGCDGRTLSVTLVGASDASLAEQTAALTTPAVATALNFAASNIAASDVVKVAVVVY